MQIFDFCLRSNWLFSIVSIFSTLNWVILEKKAFVSMEFVVAKLLNFLWYIFCKHFISLGLFLILICLKKNFVRGLLFCC